LKTLDSGFRRNDVQGFHITARELKLTALGRTRGPAQELLEINTRGKSALDIREPEIRKDEILILQDSNFNTDNVCIVTGCGTGIGRATAIAASANKLMTVGLDINEKEGKKTQKIARDMDGQMIFLQADLCKNDDLQKAIADAARLGTIKYVANIAGIQHIDSVENFPMGKSRIKEMMAPVEVANLFIFGFSRYAKYLIGGDLLFDGGMVLTCRENA